jgi:hypothetical protein
MTSCTIIVDTKKQSWVNWQFDTIEQCFTRAVSQDTFLLLIVKHTSHHFN